ncbi:hypothetical protein Tcan_11247 [Toxocara canis]|uniref:G_PROTEIN_RECEP_F1_2 domain-containing protein n=1 Tax=Toxocara canis TaxID=6265 RepID=A0A0B2V5W1_TOXCA|nr:hypothetical protein Tcan_11247 [Toxocara canis]
MCKLVPLCQGISGTFLDVQMYFKLLNVHALAMTSIVWNPLLYFWMSKVLYVFDHSKFAQ